MEKKFFNNCTMTTSKKHKTFSKNQSSVTFLFDLQSEDCNQFILHCNTDSLCKTYNKFILINRCYVTYTDSNEKMSDIPDVNRIIVATLLVK